MGDIRGVAHCALKYQIKRIYEVANNARRAPLKRVSRTKPKLKFKVKYWPRTMQAVSRADKPGTLEESAMPLWRPRTWTWYGWRLRALAAYAARMSPPTVTTTLAGLLAERAQMGATASALRGIILAVRGIEGI